MRVHVDEQPWAQWCRVYLNGVDISRWCKGADDEAGYVIVPLPRSGGWNDDELDVPVTGELVIKCPLQLEREGILKLRKYRRPLDPLRFA